MSVPHAHEVGRQVKTRVVTLCITGVRSVEGMATKIFSTLNPVPQTNPQEDTMSCGPPRYLGHGVRIEKDFCKKVIISLCENTPFTGKLCK